MRWLALDGIIDSWDMGLGGIRELVWIEAWCAVVHEITESDMTVRLELN